MANRRGPRDTPDGLLTREQAAARLGVSVRTLFTLLRTGRLPTEATVRLPTDRQRVFYVPEVLDRFAATVSTEGKGRGPSAWPEGHALYQERRHVPGRRSRWTTDDGREL